MRIAVRHHTAYRYSTEVYLGPQVLRLKPRSDAAQQLAEFSIHISPEPSGLTSNIGTEGNHELLAWFKGPTDVLQLETYAVVETLRANPFDFIWLAEHRLPLSYSPEQDEALLQYRFTEPLAESVQALASKIAVGVGEEAQPFPMALVTAIHSTCRQVFRAEGDPRPPEETLERRAGSCRDLTVLFNAIARSAGFAARFVSGYHAAAEQDRYELHAWSELYLPGGGWRGFDPSSGLAVGDRHIAIASGPRPRDAAPISGAYYGTDAGARLATSVDIQILNGDSQQLELPY
ncbi:MAG: transglutaminase N-terminal domain-containing protein [Dehalococcoidia bacterium]